MNCQNGHDLEREVLGECPSASAMKPMDRRDLPYSNFSKSIGESIEGKPGDWNEFIPNKEFGMKLYSKVFYYLTWYKFDIISKMSREERESLARRHEGLLRVSEVYEVLGFYPASASTDYYHGVDCFFFFKCCRAYVTIDLTIKEEKKGFKADFLVREHDLRDNWLLTKIAWKIAETLRHHYWNKSRRRRKSR